jgi:hypothetical protein
MKNILAIIGICFALSLCNLSQKLHGGSGSSGSGSDANVEHGQPNVLQQAALAGGKEIKWERQGMSFTVPPNWTEVENESKSFVWRSPTAGGATLNVNISPLSEDFPVDSSLEAGYEQQKTRAKNGEVDEVKWVEIDGLKGVQFREANPEKPDGFRRLQWEAFRKYSGQVQMINLMLATDGEHFDRHKDAMYGILYSTKIAH